MGDKIKEYVESNYPDIRADFVVQEEMLGLGHAIYTAVPTVKEDEVFIILGDTVFDVDLENVVNSSTTSIGVKEVEDPKRFGVALIEKGEVKKLIEKPQTPVSRLAIVGLYYIKNSKLLIESLSELIEKDIKTKNEFQLTDALQIMIEKGEKFSTFPVEGWYDCGKPETLLSTNQFLLDQNGTEKELKGVVINKPVFISESAELENCIIGPYATIAENCSIKDSIIKNSIISCSAEVEKSMLENSIIGSSAVIKGNYKRLNAGDSSEIEIY